MAGGSLKGTGDNLLNSGLPVHSNSRVQLAADIYKALDFVMVFGSDEVRDFIGWFLEIPAA